MADPSPHHAPQARALAARSRTGALSTLARDPEGYPFGSLVTVALDGRGRPLLLLSRLAEHTTNLRERPEASLLLIDAPESAGADPMASGRVTLIGPCSEVPAAEVDEAKRAFLEAHPEASVYAGFADFAMYRLEPVAVRYVGGFGRMSWVDAAAYASGQSAELIPPPASS